MHAADARPAEPRALCLVIHGGRSMSQAEVFAGQFAVLRMRPLARTLTRAFPTVAVYRLQLAVRGWNGTGFSAVRDARWAVQALRDRHPGVPIVLVGHSMGARTALRVADDPGVVGVLGLAPWWPADDPVKHLLDVPVRAVLAERDRIVPEPSTRPLIARMLTAGVDVRRTVLTSTGHAMLHRWREWNAEAITAVADLLARAGIDTAVSGRRPGSDGRRRGSSAPIVEVPPDPGTTAVPDDPTEPADPGRPPRHG